MTRSYRALSDISNLWIQPLRIPSKVNRFSLMLASVLSVKNPIFRYLVSTEYMKNEHTFVVHWIFCGVLIGHWIIFSITLPELEPIGCWIHEMRLHIVLVQSNARPTIMHARFFSFSHKAIVALYQFERFFFSYFERIFQLHDRRLLNFAHCDGNQ